MLVALMLIDTYFIIYDILRVSKYSQIKQIVKFSRRSVLYILIPCCVSTEIILQFLQSYISEHRPQYLHTILYLERVWSFGKRYPFPGFSKRYQSWQYLNKAIPWFRQYPHNAKVKRNIPLRRVPNKNILAVWSLQKIFW